jgi:glucose/arabinose dehydrogenase
MRVAGALLLTTCLLLTGCSDDGETGGDKTVPGETATPSPPRTSSTGNPGNTVPEVVDTIVTGLDTPWGLAFLPNGAAIVTERDSGRVLEILGHGVRTIGRIDETAARGEAGLLGVAVSPSFDSDHRLFFYVSTAEDNRIMRADYEGRQLGAVEPILTGIPNGFIHDGGRLAFGPDGYLYASTGETGVADLAQDRDSLGGKILRITPDGAPAPGNPDPASPIWSWGHRNVQGLAFDAEDRLWASEFGSSEYDELNLIRKGSNYGWPIFEGNGNRSKYTNPHIVWRTDEASPSGLAFREGQLWMASLKGERLWQITLRNGRATKPVDYFVGAYGRLRTVVVAPDGNLWVTTSNRDSRGTPQPGDDRILVIRP